MRIFNLFNRSLLGRELKRLVRENDGKNLSILEDAVFKAVLTSKSDDSQEALRSLLSACTRREVSKVQILNNELIPAYSGGKSPRLDVHVTFNDGETADLEMQTSKSDDDLKKRAEYYTAMLVSSQLPRGNQYKSIKRVYQIFFLDCVLFPNSEKLSRRYFYQEEEDHERLSETSEIIFYELPKLEQLYNEVQEKSIEIKKLTEEEKWCMYIRYRHEDFAGTLIERLCQEEAGIMHAEKEVYKISRAQRKAARWVAEMKDRYLRVTEEYYREQRFLKACEEARENGLAAGHAEGLTVGHAEGLTVGHAKGLAEGHTKGLVEIGKKLKARGHTTPEIVEITGLSPEVIDRL